MIGVADNVCLTGFNFYETQIVHCNLWNEVTPSGYNHSGQNERQTSTGQTLTPVSTEIRVHHSDTTQV